MSRLYLQCRLCGSQFDLPLDGTIKPYGILTVPLHDAQGDLVETESDPNCCPYSHLLHEILREPGESCGAAKIPA